MKLTGKCKEDFLKWFKDKTDSLMSDVLLLESMKWGIYVDFFDSVGIFCEDRRHTDITMAWVVKYPNFDGIQDRYDGLVKTRPEARTAAIDKANEIYNSNELQN